MGIEPKTPGVCACVCVCVCVGLPEHLFFCVCVCLLLQYLLQSCSRGGGGGHVLRETTSRGRCVLVCPSRTNERGGGGVCVCLCVCVYCVFIGEKENTFLNTVSFVKPSRTGSFTQTCSLCGVLFATRSAAQAACSPASAARAPGQLLGLWAGAGMGSGGCVAQRLTRLTRTWYLQVLQQGVRGGSRRARSQRAVRSHLPTAGSV